ncbi:UNVERIFIED_CONTAM: hypothetical protein RMT77_015990 [Armadillidium vulgare]
MTINKEELAITINASQVWAMIVSVVGGIGNLTAIIAVIHEIILNHKSQRKRRFLNNQLMNQMSKSSLEERFSPRQLSLTTSNTIYSIVREIGDKYNNSDLNTDRHYTNYLGSLSLTKFRIPRLGKHRKWKSELCVRNASSFDKISLNHFNEKKCSKITTNGLKNRNSNETPIANLNWDYNSNINSISIKGNNYRLSELRNGCNNNHLKGPKSRNNKTFHDRYSKSILSSNPVRSSQYSRRIISQQEQKPSKRRFSLLRCERATIIILCLCVTDFLYCVTNLPLTCFGYSYYFEETEPSQNFCRITAFIRYVISYAEWMTVGFLFIERCINLKKLSKAKIFTPLQTMLCISAIWLLSLLLVLPSYLSKRLGYNKQSFRCDIVSQDGVTPSLYKFYFFTILTALPCLLVLTGCVSIMVQIIQNTRNLVKIGMCENILEKRRRDTQHSLAIVSGLMILFFTCMTPMTISDTVSIIKIIEGHPSSGKTDFTDVHYSIIAYMVYWLQYAVNFLVYVVANPCFRVAYSNLVRSLKGYFCSVM